MGVYRYKGYRILGRLIIIFCLASVLFGCRSEQTDLHTSNLTNYKGEKLNGISLTSPPQPITSHWTTQIKRINANWVAIIPYAFCQSQNSIIQYNLEQQWWGEKIEGIKTLVTQAKNSNHKIMLKPQVWIPNSWPGDYKPSNQNEFEKSYTSYILTFAKIADSLNVELFCIGTEFKINTISESVYWSELIDTVKSIYKGKLTYASNWDNYENIPFWNKLDFIGVDAYFPLSKANNPTENTLINLWTPHIIKLEAFSSTTKKPILFTEYGYRSTDRATWNQWENDNNYDLPINLSSQKTAFQALYKSVWNKPWFAGGFIWKWYDYENRIDPSTDCDYTPQKKPAEKIILEFYSN